LGGKRWRNEDSPLFSSFGRSRNGASEICTLSRTNLYNMLFFLLSVTVAAIVVAIPQVRHRIWFGGDLSSTGERSEKSRITSPVKPFLVVMLPDGTIVTPRVAGKV
jgi:hypothetical protein